jgi:hypothetical protein
VPSIPCAFQELAGWLARSTSIIVSGTVGS